ncbi:unnamed protein product [Protopolystoma xenopodis]|uniref:Uncharacterized protein n=1 Tax=Protopolystoma xenopodis TaxID=117903 RepID=A0A448WPH0_9PLAT|nr:unnamed protein product [Protopolystoma xenopodis]
MGNPQIPLQLSHLLTAQASSHRPYQSLSLAPEDPLHTFLVQVFHPSPAIISHLLEALFPTLSQVFDGTHIPASLKRLLTIRILELD